MKRFAAVLLTAATCGALAAPAGANQDKIVTASVWIPQHSERYTVASCPQGYRLAKGGFETSRPDVANLSAPFANEWVVNGVTGDHGARLTAYAVCNPEG